jgi:hypothetical protein
MNYKSLLAIVMLFTCYAGITQAQDKQAAMKEKSITWFGIDFSIARFTLVTEDPTVIVNQYLKSINTLILTESTKYDLKKYFDKTEVKADIDLVNERNSKIDPTTLVVTDKYQVTPEDVQKVISSYKTQGKTGMGLVFIAENLNKVAQTGSFYVCFFDIATRKIIDAELKEAKASGIGFRNYWVSPAYNVMKAWMK